jgi:hypothetical protein
MRLFDKIPFRNPRPNARAERECATGLTHQEAPRHTKRTEGCAQQHHRRSTIGNPVAAGRSKEGDVRDVLSGVLERHCARADERFVSRDAIEFIPMTERLDITGLDQHAVQSEAAASQIP